jgi:hypothetical protein
MRRGVYVGWPDILYNEMEDSSRLFQLCGGIRLVHSLDYGGAKKDEAKLYQTLIKTIRNPWFLIEVTKEKQT